MKELNKINFNFEIARPWFALSFFWFIIIIFLGIVMRFSFAFNVVLPTPIEFTRHAHSHTAFWGWAGPAFFGFILAILIDETKRSRVYENILFWGIQLVSFCALLSFILSGYSKLSIVFSTLMVFFWLGFSFYLLKFGKKIKHSSSLLVYIVRLAVLMLVVSTFPTFFIPISVLTGFGGEVVKSIAIHFFLDSYSEGWLYVMSFVLLLFLKKEEPNLELTKFSKILLLLSFPILILVSLRSSVFLFPKSISVLIFTASLLWGILQIIVVSRLIHKELNYTFLFVSILILFKAILDIIVGLPFFTLFVQSKMFVLLYLHVKLLGIMSVSILIFVVNAYFSNDNRILYSKRIFLSGVAITLMAMLVIAMASILPSFVGSSLGLELSWLWQSGQILAFCAALPVIISVLILFVFLIPQIREF